MVSSQSLLSFLGVTESHLLYHLADRTDKEYLQIITEQEPHLEWKHEHFSTNKTPLSLCVGWYLGFIHNHFQRCSQRRGDWRAGLLLPTISAACPPLPVRYFLPWCMVVPQGPCRAPTPHIQPAVYFWATVLTKRLPPPHPRPHRASRAEILT